MREEVREGMKEERKEGMNERKKETLGTLGLSTRDRCLHRILD